MVTQAQQASTTTRGTPEVKIEPFQRNLRCKLTQEELTDRSQRAAHLLGERDHKDEELKAASKHGRAQIAELDAELRRVSSEVRDGATYREVRCERRYVFRTGMIQEVRMDTEEVIAERAMTERERQMELFEQPNGKGKNGATAKAAANDASADASDDYGEDVVAGGGEDEPDSEPEPPLETEKPKRKPGRPRKKA